MYKVNIQNKTTEKVPPTTFSDIGVRERDDIQEWIANNPDLLEYFHKLLIIQKEFDGFADTSNRLDLLALDSEGNLVIIENKRDDTGKDVVWQAINYASFCSTLTAQDVIDIYDKYLKKNGIEEDAAQLIQDFFKDCGKETDTEFPSSVQKIILVAREFRKEVLSAAQWLINNGIDITCIKFTPFMFGETVLLDVNHILPQAELKDYTLKLARKNSDTKVQANQKSQKEEMRLAFWKRLCERYDRSHTIFKDKTGWGTCHSDAVGGLAPFGHSLYFYFIIGDKKSRVELYLKGAQSYNKRVFDAFYAHREQIETNATPYSIHWQRLDNGIHSRISIAGPDANFFDVEEWDNIIDDLTEKMDVLVSVLIDAAKDIDCL